MNRNKNQMTPWGVFGIALLIVTMIVVVYVYMDFLHHRDMNRLNWMEDHPAEVNQWLRDNNGGL